MTDLTACREAFEREMHKTNPLWCYDRSHDRPELYDSPWINHAWWGWQAAKCIQSRIAEGVFPDPAEWDWFDAAIDDALSAQRGE
jgi:hypothetical protein